MDPQQPAAPAPEVLTAYPGPLRRTGYEALIRSDHHRRPCPFRLRFRGGVNSAFDPRESGQSKATPDCSHVERDEQVIRGVAAR